MIDISVLNSDLECIGVIDKYASFVWTDRYNEAGEFELYLPITSKYAQSIKKDMFLSIKPSSRLMIVEYLEITTNTEEGNYLKITGHSLEIILDRRIVWNQTNVSGSIQNALLKIIDDAIINPKDSRRKIENFEFSISADPNVVVKSYNERAQYIGDLVYDVVKKVCKAYHIGFKIEIQNGIFIFSLFAGKDRSYGQTLNSYVVFSPNNDNLRNSKYFESNKKYKNVIRIAGEGEGATQTFTTHYLEYDDEKASEKTGLDRREAYLNCHDVSSITDGNTIMDVHQYTNTLISKGVEKMVDYVPEVAFDGEIDSTVMYKYGRDFEVGDICEIRNEYGMSDQVRVTEVVQTWEPSGYTCFPTLESLSNEEGDTSSGSSSENTIIELVETTSTSIDTSGLKVQWKDIYNSSEDATISYFSHSDVKMTTQLMSIKYFSTTDTWRITILKDNTSVYNKLDGTTVVYNRMRTIEWSYADLVNYEVSYTS